MKRIGIIFLKVFVMLIMMNFVFAISLSYLTPIGDLAIVISAALSIGSLFFLDKVIFKTFS